MSSDVIMCGRYPPYPLAEYSFIAFCSRSVSSLDLAQNGRVLDPVVRREQECLAQNHGQGPISFERRDDLVRSLGLGGLHRAAEKFRFLEIVVLRLLVDARADQFRMDMRSYTNCRPFGKLTPIPGNLSPSGLLKLNLIGAVVGCVARCILDFRGQRMISCRGRRSRGSGRNLGRVAKMTRLLNDLNPNSFYQQAARVEADFSEIVVPNTFRAAFSNE